MEFSEAPSLDSFNSGGLVKQAFQEGVRRYLQYYRACILSLKPNLTLLGLSLQLKGIVAQMRYLGRLCKCHSEESFPTGVQLLSYLHAVAIDSVSSPHHGVMLFLFRKSCQPYLRFLEDWVFYGTFNDAYKEFMIEINPIYLNYRDKMFWTRAFVMSLNADGSSAVPVFLADLANSIYVCGKSINLLKLCQQNHYLFTKRQTVPRLDVCFTEEELVAMETECSVYISKVKALGHQQMQLREERKAAAAAARRELIQKVRVTAAMETARLEEM
ncbi:hypothetical protein CAPTEDRAFT_206819 [Capitella teleta]|uniref:Gamma-tubulin complex component n=1 Tax=Capitella teleta TaxID=283909 RepID=R7U9F3_CAPTE|nr:hypothetical protein CAPTEDRAFT_206819 [Capitella teleta]|eukprot:ELU02965.1 hypothetical protein CAPTEDRAFT_206819 [Capitella teleta]